MNMHGIIAPVSELDVGKPGHLDRIKDWIWSRRTFLLVVAVPTLLVAAYLYIVASDQYESEAHFLVQTASKPDVVAGSGMSQALSFVTGQGAGQSSAMSVADYLTSHDVVATLRAQDQLVERFHRTGVDPLSRLNSANPTPERLLKYYRKRVSVTYNSETGITTLKVRSFAPDDSYHLARKLLVLGEHRVNMLNARSYEDAIAMARRQLADAEAEMEKTQLRMTAFRRNRGDVDPEASARTQIALVSNLTGQLAAARAQLNAMGGMINRSSPQYRALAARVNALEAQVSAQSGRLTVGNRAIATNIGGYQALELRQQFLAKRYEAAAATLQKAREEALRQQLYLVRVVEANKPVKPLFPERFRILATVTIALLLAYSIGWLIVAGVKEHAA